MLFICPKAGECKYICGSSHDKPHNQKDGCIGYPLQGCPACIPVPSTLAKPKIITKREQFFNKVGCPIWEECKDEGKTMITWCDFCSKRPIAAPASEGMLTIPQLKLNVAKFIGEQYHPHENFDTLPHGVRADLLYFADEILAKVSASFSAQLAEALKAQKAHILAEVDKAGLTNIEIAKVIQTSLGTEAEDLKDFEWMATTQDKAVAAAQLEAIKK